MALNRNQAFKIQELLFKMMQLKNQNYLILFSKVTLDYI